MLPKRFAEAAAQARDSLLADGARQLIDGRTRDGRQVSVFRGLAPGETARDSLGRFVIVTAEDSKPHPADTNRNNDASVASVETIPAGSTDVHHPSHDRYTSDSLRVAASIGLLTLPDLDLFPDRQVLLGNKPVYPRGMRIPAY